MMQGSARPGAGASGGRSIAGRSVHSPEYRPDIDGLRAIAVVAVLVYHAFPRLVPGGFAGVDIFFVISGFLITGIIRRQMLEKRFNLLEFYARRVLRICPALIPVVLATLVIGAFLLSAAEMEALGANLAGAALFVQNFILLQQIVGYFDPGADRLPLLHLWSLAIEEQYYIVWPTILLLIARWRLRPLLVVSALLLISFSTCILTPPNEAAWAFYSPLSRVWELLVGSILRLWRSQGLTAHDPRRGEGLQPGTMLALAGLGGIATAFWGFSATTPWPGVRTVVPVVAAAALIATGNTMLHRRLLSSRPMVSIGLISYPLYLWHFPLMAYAKLSYGGDVPGLLMCGLLALSLLLAWLTYRLIERPIRFGSSPMRLRATPLLAGLAATGLLGLIADSTRGLPMRFPQPIRGFMLSGSETWMHWRRDSCLLVLQPASEFASECAGSGRHPLLLIWGDSYGAALYPGLAHVSRERAYDVAQYTASACPPLIGYTLPERPFCTSINDDVVARIGRLRPDVVILASTWGHAEQILRDDLPRTVSRLRALKVPRIVLMGPTPGWQGAGLPATVLDYYRQTGVVLPARTFYHSTEAWTRDRDTLLQQLSGELGIDYISVRNVFCNDDGCLSRIGPGDSQLTIFDSGHLTVPGAIFLAAQTLDRILGTDVPPGYSGSTGTPR
jgi:peptidoglycan/LPS O-acetylase OafA/YrhL